MQVVLLWAAAVMSIVTFSVHTFVGGPVVVKPLLASTELSKASKWLNYYTWHVTTVFTLYMSAGFSYVAFYPERPELVIFLIVTTATFSILSAVVAIKGKINPFRFPSTSLFGIVSLLGLASLLVE